VEGTPLRAPYQHVRLKYKINAIYCQIISYLGIIGLVYAGIMPATYGYDNFVQLLTSAWIFSVILTTLIYLDSIIRIPREEDQLKGPLYMLSLCGNGGSFTYDYWMGRTLNPRVGFLDLKYVCELRPGLILWSLLNLSIAAAQYHELGYVSLSMVLVCIFQAYYVIDSNTSEQAILTTMDIRDDGFGFMLVFGDLTWVPFTYTMQSRYLVTYDPGLSIYAALAIVGVKLLGLWIFRSSNNEKNMFRTNPNHPSVKHLKFITTTSGRNLICSGWWGTSRHINYFGDVIMALAWSLPCGFGSIMPYFYPIYFAALLINREGRDHEKCHRNYGKDWDLYCQKVPYRIIPYVY
jgi:protein-S-isoprenylcysteine O-methyltransferase Ste14